jgi:hypothetical protein
LKKFRRIVSKKRREKEKITVKISSLFPNITAVKEKNCKT